MVNFRETLGDIVFNSKPYFINLGLSVGHPFCYYTYEKYKNSKKLKQIKIEVSVPR